MNENEIPFSSIQGTQSQSYNAYYQSLSGDSHRAWDWPPLLLQVGMQTVQDWEKPAVMPTESLKQFIVFDPLVLHFRNFVNTKKFMVVLVMMAHLEL